MPDFDILIAGSGPAGTALAAALGEHGLRVGVVSPVAADAPWPNTYGIWADEVEALGLTHTLGRRWQNCVSYVDDGPIQHARDYALFDNAQLQAHLLAACERAAVRWITDYAAGAEHAADRSTLVTSTGARLTARLLVDASGHRPALLSRPTGTAPAFQAAYGVIGRLTGPPTAPDQLVLMDWRTDHLTDVRRAEPPTFLYAMDLGDGRYLVEETSLAHAPALGFDVLEARLHQRLAHRGVAISNVEHVEHCLFPMNLPLPARDRPIFGYGGAASMVHPASGYQVGAALRSAEPVAQTIAAALADPACGPAGAADAAWRALWPPDRLRRRALYLFGLENVLRFDAATTQAFFAAFFALPYAQWSGYLSDRLTSAELAQTMWALFRHAPPPVRLRLATSVGTHWPYLARAVRATFL